MKIIDGIQIKLVDDVSKDFEKRYEAVVERLGFGVLRDLPEEKMKILREASNIVEEVTFLEGLAEQLGI